MALSSYELLPASRRGSKSSLTTSKETFNVSEFHNSLPDTKYTAYANDDESIIHEPVSGFSLRSFLDPKEHNTPTWRGGMMLATSCVMLVLLVNFIVTIWAGTSFEAVNGIAILFSGSCSRTKSLSTWLHLLINAHSTVLLGASNYAMQCVTAPTRREVDTAHSQGRWFDIGVPSVRNVSKIGKMKVAMWAVLVLSSFPLHLLYNSAIYESQGINSFVVAVVTPDFAEGAAYNSSLTTMSAIRVIPDMQKNATSYTRLENEDCIRAYGIDLLLSRRNVLAVTSNTTGSGGSLLALSDQRVDSLTIGHPEQDPQAWICSSIAKYAPRVYPYLNGDLVPACNINDALPTASSWQVFNQPISYCLSQEVPETCKLQFSITIMAVVIACNIIKITVMVLAFTKLARQHTLVTAGDAAASFLSNPDPATANCSLLSKHDVQKKIWAPYATLRCEYTPRPHRWSSASSKRRWALTLFLCFAVWAVAIGLLGEGISTLKLARVVPTASNLWKMGFGAVNGNSLVRLNPGGTFSPKNSTLGYILLANTPQLIVSGLYFMYNGLWSSMLMAREWMSYATKRKGLRVSAPLPGSEQRSTYFVSMPLRYVIPLLVSSSLLHWLTSQSIFLAKLEVYDEYGTFDAQHSITTVGYSSVSLIFVIVLGAVMIGVLVGFAMKRLEGDMPLAGSCSLAISAACHPLEEGMDGVSEKAVMWGVISGTDRCGLSSQTVETPEVGRFYE